MHELALPPLTVILQGVAFFFSIYIAGFVYGHESVISYLHRRLPDFDRKKAPWKQTESLTRAKTAARDYFPLYWYWGNMRIGIALCAVLIAIDLESGTLRAGAVAALAIGLCNYLLYRTSKQERWNPRDTDKQVG